MNAIPILMLDLGMPLRGGQRQVQYLARYLTRRAVQHQENEPVYMPVIACPVGSGLEKAAREDGLNVIPLPGHSLANPLVWLAIRRILRAVPVRILHTHDAHSALAGAVFKRMNPALRLVHSRRVSYAPSKGLRLWKYAVADAVVGVSRDIAVGMTAAGIDGAKIHTIHSGLAPETYTPRIPHGQETPFIFLSVGALTPQKGFAVLIEAAAHLASKCTTKSLPQWRVRIVGDGPLMPSLLADVERLNLQDCVELPGRRESRAELPHCDALIVPSVDGEGSSAVIKEAWVTEVPLIASDLPSNLELLKNSVNGLAVKTGDAQSLSEAMERIISAPDTAAALVRGGRDTLPLFTDTRMAESYRLLYNTLI